MTKSDTILASAPVLPPREAIGLAVRWAQARLEGAGGQRALQRALDNLPGLDRIAQTFGLHAVDRRILLAALLPRIDDRAPLATLARLETALGPHSSLRARLAPDAPLRRYALVHLSDGYTPAERYALTDERVEALVLGDDWLDPRMARRIADLPIASPPPRHAEAIETAMADLHADMPARFLIDGPDGCRLAAARHAAQLLGRYPVVLRPQTLPGPYERPAFWALAAREAALDNLVYVLDADADRDLAEDAARDLSAPLILHSNGTLPPVDAACTIRLAPIDTAGRSAAWAAALGQDCALADELGATFGLGPDVMPGIVGQIRAQRDAPFAVVRRAAAEGLDQLIARITPRQSIEDLVLDEETAGMLAALIAQGRNRITVHGLWGFNSGAAQATGVSALFSGRSGVGKTMAAEALAHALQRDLYRVDLSSTVSKYIGETEKALARIFDAAERAGAVLFFDEADTLFGKRTEIRDSKDRWANLGVSYLLQRMERFGGICVLATNLKSQIDIAFLRRLRYVIDFPWPDANLRERIWRQVFPTSVPCDALDYTRLGQLDLAGGHIGLVAVNAAFLAADRNTSVGMAEIETAARAEFRKLDKPFPARWREARP
jgi:hypothetical protein